MFKSKPAKVWLGINCVGLLASTATSLMTSYKLATICISAATDLLNIVENNVTLPKMSTIVTYETYNFSVLLQNVDIELPPSWITEISGVAEEAPLCFWVGLISTFLLTMLTFQALAWCIAVGMHLKEQNRHYPALINSFDEDEANEAAFIQP